jgi:hypothetical protein
VPFRERGTDLPTNAPPKNACAEQPSVSVPTVIETANDRARRTHGAGQPHVCALTMGRTVIGFVIEAAPAARGPRRGPPRKEGR